MNKQCGKNLKTYYQCTDRIIIKLNTHLTTTMIIQVYLPTTAYNDDEIEEYNMAK